MVFLRKLKTKDYFSVGVSALKVKLGKKVPLRVTFIATNACNLRCRYCYAEDYDKRKAMDTQEVKDMMKEFKYLGTKVWKFGGGEPLLRGDIEELIDYGIKLGFIVNIDTNGTFVAKKIHILKKLDNVQISIDGPRELHDSIRGEGVFDKCIEALRLLNENGIKPLINCVISEANLDNIENMVELARMHNAFINFQPIVPVTEEAKEMMSKKLIENNVFNRILFLKKKYDFIAVSENSLKRFQDYYSGRIDRFQEKKCLAGQIYCIVSPQGEVARCIGELGRKNVPGKEQGFGKAMNQLSDDYSCDCTFCNFRDMSELYSLKPTVVLRSVKNLKNGKWIYN